MGIEESIPKKIFLPLDTFCFICHTSFYYNDCTLQIEGRGVITDFFFSFINPLAKEYLFNQVNTIKREAITLPLTDMCFQVWKDSPLHTFTYIRHDYIQGILHLPISRARLR